MQVSVRNKVEVSFGDERELINILRSNLPPGALDKLLPEGEVRFSELTCIHMEGKPWYFTWVENIRAENG